MGAFGLLRFNEIKKGIRTHLRSEWYLYEPPVPKTLHNWIRQIVTFFSLINCSLDIFVSCRILFFARVIFVMFERLSASTDTSYLSAIHNLFCIRIDFFFRFINIKSVNKCIYMSHHNLQFKLSWHLKFWFSM